MIVIPKTRRRGYLITCRVLSVLSTVAAILYLKWLFVDARIETPVLYWVLVTAETFNVLQAAGFWYTISNQRWSEPPVPQAGARLPIVDVFVTVYGEPLDIIERTVRAAAALDYPNARVYVLDDGGSDTVHALAARLGVDYLRRPDHRGHKAGNLNEALKRTTGELVAIFDADQAPHRDFLGRTVRAFEDDAVAFVQTPQVYRNRDENRVAAGAHDQQALFYGPIMRGKNGLNSVFSCGTNVVYRRAAIREIGGFPEDSITEDLRTSLMLLHRGYRSVYVSEILAEGLGPLDVGSYFNQQYRWGHGGLEILLRRHPYRGPMRFSQRIQYMLGFIYWFTGWAYLAYLVLPLAFLFGGLRPVGVPNEYPVHFLPYALTALGTLIYAADFTLRFDALWFTLASFPVHVKALFATVLGRASRFVVTPKVATGRTLRPVVVHLLLLLVLGSAAVYGLVTQGPAPSVVNNVAWAIAHVVILQGFVRYAHSPETPESDRVAVEPASGSQLTTEEA